MHDVLSAQRCMNALEVVLYGVGAADTVPVLRPVHPYTETCAMNVPPCCKTNTSLVSWRIGAKNLLVPVTNATANPFSGL
eukprot:m.693573 g.693573  ORF g.693573 m.693573 type:complete len:80 (-) comp22873_c0_seq20:1576-1815(-)